METIKDYLHLYLGCEMLVGGTSRVFLTPNRFDVVFRNHDNILQLLLRPLSSMTDEESDTAISFWTNNEDDKIGVMYATGEVAKYLLSKHFDLFGLIERGLAIDVTKLNKVQNVQECDATDAQSGNRTPGT